MSLLGKRQNDGNKKGGNKRVRNDDHVYHTERKVYTEEDMNRLRHQMNHNFSLIIKQKNDEIERLQHIMAPNHLRMRIQDLENELREAKKLNKQFANQMQLITRIIQDLDRENGLHIQQAIQTRLNNV
tara:strand:- start:3322 stop:3705 length:384 start_codon:yes stop_codon:yes gene_type:complete